MNATTILIIVNVFAALAIIVLALMQQSKGDMGSAFGGGGSSGMFGARGSANFLSRCTSVMCAVFFVSSLALAYIYAQRGSADSVVEQSVLEQTIESEVPTIDVPAEDAVEEVPSVDEAPSSDENSVPSIDVEETDVEETVEPATEAAAEEVDAATTEENK